MLKKLVLLLVILCCEDSSVSSADNVAPFRDLLIYAEINPPFSFEHQGKVSGLYVDLVEALLVDVGAPQRRDNIIIAPWTRAYTQTLRRDNALLFAVARTPERESLFKWIGPIGEFKAVLFARKDRQVDITKGFSTFLYGVTSKSKSESYLLEAGVPGNKIVHINSADSAAHMLARGRIDAWVRDYTVASWTLQEQGYALNDFEVVHTFKGINRYIALNVNTDDRIIAILQSKLEAYRASGKLASLTKSRPMRLVEFPD